MAPELPAALLELAAAVRQDALPELMTAAEAARALGVCDEVFRAMVRARKIRHIMIGARKKFTAADLREFIERQRDAAPCRSTSPKARPSTDTISGTKVIGITALLASRSAKKRKP